MIIIKTYRAILSQDFKAWKIIIWHRESYHMENDYLQYYLECLECFIEKWETFFFLLLSFQKKMYMCSIILVERAERAALSSTVHQTLRCPGDKRYQPFAGSPASLTDCWELLIMSSQFRKVLSFSSSFWGRKTEILIKTKRKKKRENDLSALKH